MDADRLDIALSRTHNEFVVVGDVALTAKATDTAEFKVIKYI